MKKFYPIRDPIVERTIPISEREPGINYRETVVAGNKLGEGPSKRRNGARVVLYGDSQIPVMLDKDILDRNIGVVGNSGSGKTVMLRKMARQINDTLRPDETLIIFDSKGDFYEDLYQPGDLVFGINAIGEETPAGWNVFREVAIDGPEKYEENAFEIAKNLFAERRKNTTNQFFPDSAADLLACIILLLLYEGECRGEFPDNRLLYETCCLPSKDLLQRMRAFPQLRGVDGYIGRDSNQSDGIRGELRNIARDLFIGAFGRPGQASVRDIIRNHPECQRIFVCYDVSYGKVLEPIFRTLCDLCIKETLRRNNRHEVWLFMDEFRLTPCMQNIENGVSFGRGRLHLIIGLQYIGQIRESYTENIADGMMANLGTLIAFRTEDAETRKMISHRFGTNRTLVQYYAGQEKGTQSEIRETQVVEDWNIVGLKTGQAIIGHPGEAPYRFYFRE